MALRDLARRARDGSRAQLVRQEARRLRFADPRLEALRVALRVPAPGEEERLPHVAVGREASDWDRLLLRLVVALGPLRCLELGAPARIDGAPVRAGLEQRGAGRLVTHPGPDGLPDALADLGEVHLALLAADRSTPAAVTALLAHAVPGTLLVLDDADDGAASAWRALRDHPRVTGSLAIGPVGFAVVDGVPDRHAELAGLALW